MKTLILACILALVPGLAFAQAYIGGSYGVGKTDILSLESVVTGLFPDLSCDTNLTCPSSIDDSAAAVKIFGGYKFTPNFAAEGFVAKIGTFSSSTTAVDYLGDSLTLSADLDATAFGVSGVGFLPISKRIDLFAKLGVFHWSSDTDALAVLTIDGVSESATASVSDSGNDLLFGAGVDFDITKHIGIRAELERYNTDEAIDVASIGVMFSF